MTLRELIEKRNKILVDARQLMSADDVSVEQRSKVDAMLTEANGLKADIERLEACAESEERSLPKPGIPRAAVKRTSRRVKTAAPSWLQMWSIARYDLSLTSDEFYALTPRQFDALLKRKEHADTIQEFLFGQLASVAANFSMSRPKNPTTPQDFMPSQWKPTKPKRRTRRTIARKLNSIFRVHHASPDDHQQQAPVGQAESDVRQAPHSGDQSGSA